jgi:uncharacterized membrane protein
MSTPRSREQVEATLRTLRWWNPITGLVFVICAIVGFWYTAAAFAIITVVGVYRFGMANRELATFDTTDDPR